MNSLAARQESRPTESWFLRVHPRLSAAPPWRRRLRYGNGLVDRTGEWRQKAGSGGTQVVYDLKTVAKGGLVAFLGLALSAGADAFAVDA